MKKVMITLLAAVISSSFALGENLPTDKEKNTATRVETPAVAVVVKGNVIDSNSKESLTGVALEIVGTKTVVYTDFDGNFQVNDLEPGQYNIIVRYVSYQPHLIENVYLRQGVNTLQPIKLIAN